MALRVQGSVQCSKIFDQDCSSRLGVLLFNVIGDMLVETHYSYSVLRVIWHKGYPFLKICFHDRLNLLISLKIAIFKMLDVAFGKMNPCLRLAEDFWSRDLLE